MTTSLDAARRHAIQPQTAETAARIHAEVTAQAASLLALLMIERDVEAEQKVTARGTMAPLPKYCPRACPDHEARTNLSHSAWVMQGDHAEANGHRQRMCSICGCWLWPVERCAEFKDAGESA